MLRAGEYFATQNGEVLYTLTGSCITTCIYDKERKVAGMNHFLLPGVVRHDEMLTSEMGRYGMFAMELLIGGLIKLGARREALRAKAFGGGNVLTFRSSDGDITGSNIRFVRRFLELENIPIVKEDLGGNGGRKVLFFSDSNRVLLKRMKAKRDHRVFEDEWRYKRRIFQKRLAKPPVRLF